MRSSPVIAPPSLVATICFLISSSLVARVAQLAWRADRSSETSCCALGERLAHRVDLIDERAHVAEQRVRLHHRRRTAPCDRRPCTARGDRGRSSSLVSSTSVPLGQPHRVRARARRAGPATLPNATCAARGTRGGLTRIVHATRLMPRRLLGVIVSISLPLGVEHLELDRAEDVARAQVVRDHRAARRVRRRRTSRRPRPSRRRAGMRCCDRALGRNAVCCCERRRR